MSSYLEKLGERRTVVPQRSFYSEAVANAPLVEEELSNIKGPANENKLAWRVMTEVYSPIITKFDTPPRPDLQFFQEAWKIGEEVAEEEDAFPQELRRHKIEWSEKESIATVRLARKQVDYSTESVISLMSTEALSDIAPPPLPKPHDLRDQFSLMGKGHFLPIHFFDDAELDLRTPQEWLETGASGDKDNSTYLVPVEALLPNWEDQTRYDWVPAFVTSYDVNSGLFTLQHDKNNELQVQVPRIYIRFKSEDPRTYKQRVLDAVNRRDEIEGAIRYQLCIDCMPFYGTREIDPEALERMKKIGTLNGKLKVKDDQAVARVMLEVCNSYSHDMCSFQIENIMNVRPDFFPFLQRPTKTDMEVPLKGMMDVLIDDYEERRKFAYWENLFAMNEAFIALSFVVAECERVSELLLFSSDYGKTAPLDEFENLQRQTTQNVISALQSTDHLEVIRSSQTTWLSNISNNVRMCLGDVGKGWYNINEKKWDIYVMSKLYRLLNVTRFRMESAVFSMATNSINFIVNLVETPCQCCLEVLDDFAWGKELVDSPFKPSTGPVFYLHLRMDENGPFFSTNPDAFEPTILNLFDSALLASHSIPRVDSLLLTNLRFPKDSRLCSIGLLDPYVIENRQKLQTGLQKAVIPLRAYLREYNEFTDFYNLKVTDYIRQFGEAEHTATEFKDAVLEHNNMRDFYSQSLPTTIIIGPFVIQVGFLKTHLISKRQEVANKLLDLFAHRMRDSVEQVLNEYADIYRKVVAKPTSIDNIIEIKDYNETVPYLVKVQDEITRRRHLEYEVLDYFWYSLSDDDFGNKWEALAWPLRMQKTLDDTEAALIADTEHFLKIYQTEEAEHQERILFLTDKVAQLTKHADITRVKEIAVEVAQIWKGIRDAQEHSMILQSQQKLFNIPVISYEDLTNLSKEFQPYRDLWATASEWVNSKEIWSDNPLENVDLDSIERIATDCNRVMAKLARTFADYPAIQNIAIETKRSIDEFRPFLPTLIAMKNPGLKQRHLDQLRDETGVKITLSPTLTFNSCLQAGLAGHTERMVFLSETAGKEFAIEQMLDKMEKEWDTVILEVQPYKNSGTYIMKITDEELQLLDDHILLTQQQSFSPFVGIFEKRVTEWEAKLRLVADVVEEWIQLQIQWMYLEPIFSSPDIANQLPAETKKYNTMLRMWKRVMKTANDFPKVIAICPDRRLLESLREGRKLLDQVLKGLSQYLESKRQLFPRFFFLSDDELLEILAQGRNPLAVQPHLRKCFENIYKLKFEKDLQISKMYSAEGEEVPLSPPMYPLGNVEIWMSKVEETMRSTVRETLAAALIDLTERPRTVWVLKWPGQIVIAGCQVAWTAGVEHGLRENRLTAFQDQMQELLDGYRSLVRGELTRMARMMMSALIVIEVHARDVLDNLVTNDITTPNDFDWISQLRYYWIDDTDLKVRAVNAEFQYGYEYLGNSPRLVITPLTDRCYLTLTGALHLNFGGAPAGPAGTGKTETTKDLAKALANQCVVFNCSDQLDVQAMSKFFKGLASSGAWACFDEFNRIDIEVLSVVAQQVVSIQKALASKMERFLFEGVELALRPSAAVFITMNPGYAGRTELPDNLKALFRPVAMMVPNYTLIAEISLFSFGFSDAKRLANKITTTFKLSSEQLSSQDHYDFGMRAVKTVIAVAGNLKREMLEMGESQIVWRALNDVNVPKFLKDDLVLFKGIVSDLFPKLVEPPMDYGNLDRAIREQIVIKGLQPIDGYVTKVIQLYDTTVVRHGLMLVGPTGSGKTKCYEILRDAMTSIAGEPSPTGLPFEPAHAYVLNPKSITMGQLYGEFDAVTHEWTDGILPSLVRVGVAAEDLHKRWFIFDGPVDAIWIENMNTVLDDNKKLCLTSGEIIKLTEAMTMMFEVADLAVASPATVSRCGMVYVEPAVLGLTPFVHSWIQRLPKTQYLGNPDILITSFSDLLMKFVLPAIAFVRTSIPEMVPSVDVTLLQGVFRLLDARLVPFFPPPGKNPPGAAMCALLPGLVPAWVSFAVVWSVGSTCDLSARPIFSEWMRKAMKQLDINPLFPSAGLVYDYRLHDGGFLDPVEENEANVPKWIHWMSGQPKYTVPSNALYSEIEVPTIDGVRSAALLGLLIERHRNVACIGPTGSGKTLIISAKLGRGLPNTFICDILCFSARTSANQTQDVIDAKLDRRRKNVYGPPPNKHQLFFIDDFNMPAVEVYGAQPPIELVRQWLDFGGWYDRKSVGEFRSIVDVNLVVAMGPPGGGRNPVTQRCMRHFHYIAFPQLGKESQNVIFGTITDSWLSRTQSLKNLTETVVNVTVNVYDTIFKELLPTPAKTHYTFNLRDLSKVFQGMLMLNPTSLSSLEDLVRLWYHENCRVYQDRLVNDRDRDWFDQLLRQFIDGSFKVSSGGTLGNHPLFYGDLLSGEGEKEYALISDYPKLKNALEQFLEDYNAQSTSPMRLVLFEDAVQHVCRIARIVRQPQGNALLLGMGGSGRRSLAKLAAFVSELNVFQIELSRAYGMNEWREDIRQLLLHAGLYNREGVFLFSDTQIKTEAFLEDLNNILNAGDVPNIYQAEDMDKILQTMRGVVTEMGIQATRSNMFTAYQRIVKNNLHNIITMSPVGDMFRARLRMFPALVNCCTIDWFFQWPDAALKSVALRFLSDVPGLELGEKLRDGMVGVCQIMHSSVVAAAERFKHELSRHYYVTPTSYLELLSSYAGMVTKKRAEYAEGIVRLKKGLDKLETTREEVKILQKDLSAMKPALLRSQQEAAAVYDKISRDTAKAEETRAIAEKEEENANAKRAASAAIAADAEKDLAEALPALLEAENSLRALNKNDISEVRALKKPPDGVRLVIEAICIAKGVPPNRVAGPKLGEKVNDFWTPGMALLANPDRFLESLVTYDKENISEDVIKKLKPYIENPQFQPSFVIKVSKACGSLCIWTHAIYKFYFVYLNVRPKKEKLAEANAELVLVEKALRATRQKMADINAGLEALREALEIVEAQKAELEGRAQLCEDRMDRANRLINGLASERERWILTVDTLRENQHTVIGDILISAGGVAYLTPLTDSYRRSLLSTWIQQAKALGVPMSDGTNPVTTLGDAVLIRLWQVDGLPRDSLSIESAVLVANSRRWPLFIDPQGQANRWIRNMNKEINLVVLKLSDKDMLRSIETAIRAGRPVLLENIYTELDPVLDPVLQRSTYKQGNSVVLKLGDTVVPYNPDFKLYITTKLANPHYLPEVAIKVLLVNFALVPSGLTDQLLARVVMEERPDLEEARSAIFNSSAQMKSELKEIEDRILLRLSLSEGSPVDDIDLILTLEASKAKSEEIMAKVEASEETQKEIDRTRAGYLPVANRAQILFFCLADMAKVDPMYQYSLEWFINIFAFSMVNSEKGETLEERLNFINDTFTFSLFSNVCRSLFERHKLWFGVLMCSRILLDAKRLRMDELMWLLAGATPTVTASNPAPSWLSERSWSEIRSLATLPRMQPIYENFASQVGEYKALFDSTHPHRGKFPDANLDSMQRLLIIRALRPDRLSAALQDWLGRQLGQRFVEPQPADVALMYKDATGPTTPLVFVLSQGTDPAAELFLFADKMRMSKRLGVISLGQGQGPIAENMFNNAVETGAWVFFQNCHLAPSWMPRLEQLTEQLNPDQVHRDFRVWLTSMPSPAFPASILQASSKMAIEPPRGIKANLLRAYSSQVNEVAELYNSEQAKALHFRRLVFSLCLFHAMVIERRKFGPLGFNIPYEFTEGDLRICLSQLKMFLLEYQDVPFKVLKYTAGQINYGGRVTDDWDRRTISYLLSNYYKKEALQENFAFDASKIYHQLPPTDLLAEHLLYLRTLPLDDNPELFGLHANADISCAQAMAFAGLDMLASLQPRTVVAAADDKQTVSAEEKTTETAKAIYDQMPKPFDEAAVSRKHPVSYGESFNTVLVQEVVRFNKLLNIVRSSLLDLDRALKGLVVLSETLEAVAVSLDAQKVPARWSAKAYPSLKPLGAWVEDLKARIAFIQKWIDEGIPPAFWISGFFFPQAFLTGALQNFARKYVLSIDTVGFDFKVLHDKPTTKPADGCVVYGLFMEGARWGQNEGTIVESLPKELYTNMSPILMTPEVNHVTREADYICPVYKTLQRAGTLSTTGHSTNYVLAAELPSREDPGHWVARGVALICALDY